MIRALSSVVKMHKDENTVNELCKKYEMKAIELKRLQENARQLNEILLVYDLRDLTDSEKMKTILDIANYYVQHIQDKIIELEESGKHI